MTDIACTLKATDVDQRVADWQDTLAHVTARTANPDGGLRLAFDDQLEIDALARLVADEQGCCAFFAFAITVDERGLALEVNAPEPARELVTTLFGAPD